MMGNELEKKKGQLFVLGWVQKGLSNNWLLNVTFASKFRNNCNQNFSFSVCATKNPN